MAKKKTNTEATFEEPLCNPETENPTSADEPEIKCGNATALLNVRFGPSMTDKILLIVEAGTQFDILDDSDPEWYKVANGETVGYCMKRFIEVL